MIGAALPCASYLPCSTHGEAACLGPALEHFVLLGVHVDWKPDIGVEVRRIAHVLRPLESRLELDDPYADGLTPLPDPTLTERLPMPDKRPGIRAPSTPVAWIGEGDQCRSRPEQLPRQSAELPPHRPSAPR